MRGDDIVTVMKFTSPSEANIICSMLQDHGIACMLTGCNMNTLYTNVAIEIELIARREDLDRIEQILTSEPLIED